MKAATIAWETLKDAASAGLGLSHAALHILAGLLLLLLIAAIARRPPTSWWLLAPILALELANEASDAARYWLSGWPWSPVPALIDIALTLAAPVLIVAVARRRAARASPATTSG